jgi:hypothetical protein
VQLIKVNLGNRFSIAANAKCPGFGCTVKTFLRRHSYHSQTSLGFLRNAAGVARSSGLKLAHNPVCASRKVGTPLSADTPAPVSTAT